MNFMEVMSLIPGIKLVKKQHIISLIIDSKKHLHKLRYFHMLCGVMRSSRENVKLIEMMCYMNYDNILTRAK